MPKLVERKPPSSGISARQHLYLQGCERVQLFCEVNGLSTPKIAAHEVEDWRVGACAYYRNDTIKICLSACATPCTESQSRNWNWPGSTTDREPYGVLCHELGHHCDRVSGKRQWSYGSEYCQEVMKESREEPITSYCPNPAEWFAEIFRLFVTNSALLKLLRPKTHAILLRKFKPVSNEDWVAELSTIYEAPPRILLNLKKKIKAVG